MSRPIQWPKAAVGLRRDMRPSEIYEALGISRQTASNWRARYGMPHESHGVIDVEKLAAWLKSLGGCTVVWLDDKPIDEGIVLNRVRMTAMSFAVRCAEPGEHGSLLVDRAAYIASYITDRKPEILSAPSGLPPLPPAWPRDTLLNRVQVCAKFGITCTQFDKWKSEDGFPKPVTINMEGELFTIDSVREWYDKRTR